MTRSSPTPNRSRRQPLAADVAELRQRVAAVERDHRLLRNTVCALARDAGTSVGSPCTRCDRAYVLIADGMLYCPRCKAKQVL